jgi:hypothetical protein
MVARRCSEGVAPVTSDSLPPDIDHTVALDAVRRLCARHVSATAERVAELFNLVGPPVDADAVRDVLEELADKRELGRLQSAAHLKGRELEWETSYFPTRAS